MALPRFQQRDHIYTLGPPLLPVANPVPQLPNEYAVLSSLAPGQQVLGLPVNLDKDAPWVMRRRALRIKYDSTQSGTTHIFTGINQLMVRFTGHDQHYLQQSPVPQNLDGAFFGQFGAWKPSFPGVAFPAGGTFLVDIINNGPATLTNVTLYFRGVKLFPWGVRPDYRYPAVVSSIPYAYPINWTPAASVTKLRAMPLSVSITVTAAPASTAPVWSVTLPRIRPKLPCASSETENSSTLRAEASRYTLLPTWAIFDVTDFIRHPVFKRREKTTLQGRLPRLESLTRLVSTPRHDIPRHTAPIRHTAGLQS